MKYIVFLLLGVVAYFAFVSDSYPSSIEFRGYSLGSKENNNDTVDKEFDIFSYRDSSNHHILMFGIRNNSRFTLEDLTKQYLANFQRQGFKFIDDGSRQLGVKGDEAIYITESKNMEAIVIYVEKGASPMPKEPDDGASVFSDLEYFLLK